MQLYFIRHAQSENNAILERNAYKSEEGRHADPQITAIGLEQAKLLAEFLAKTNPEAEIHGMDMQNRRGFGLTHLYCSLMERSVQTGVVLAERLGLPLVALTDLHELGGIYLEELVEGELREPILHGHTPDYFREHYPLLQFDEFPTEGWWHGGREARELWLPRAQRLLTYLFERHGETDDHVAVITHAGFYSRLFQLIFRPDFSITEEVPFNALIVFNNCAISRFDVIEGRLFFMYHNRAEFLPDEMIT